MHWADPPFVTQMEDDPDARGIWFEVFDHFGGEHSADAEFLHVAAIMADLFPWVLGSEGVWSDRAERMKARSLALRSAEFSPEDFAGRGAYGDYFENQARRASLPDSVQGTKPWWSKLFRLTE